MRHLVPVVVAILVLWPAASCSGGGRRGAGLPLQPGTTRAELVLGRARLGFEHATSAVLGLSADGLFEQRIASASGVERRPRLAPDGTRVAFVRQRRNGEPTSDELFVAHVDRGADELRLTDDDTVDDAPCWSPDGTRIAFTSERLGDGPRLFLVDAAGGAANPIWNDAADQTDPDWSSAAGRIVFARRGASTRFELWTVAPDGTSPTALTDGGLGAGDREPCWSADGSTVIFVRWLDATRSTLARVDVATSQVTLLLAPVTTARFPRLAPRGDRLFFAGSDPSAGVDTLRLWVGRGDASEALLLIADDREAVTGLDCAADLPAASTAPRAWTPVRLDSARVSNLQGLRVGGSYDAILAEGGAELTIETVEQDDRQIGGLELTIPLGVEPQRVAAIEVTVRAAITGRDPTTRLRATLADYVSERHATHVHVTPSSDAFVVQTWRASGPRCVDRRGDVRVSVVADRATGGTATLHLDHVGVRVLIETP